MANTYSTELTRRKMWSSKFAETRGKEKSLSGLLCLLLFVTFLGRRCEAKEEVELRRNNAFDNKLYQAISEENSKDGLTNLIFSPLSLEIVLAVLGLGAGGSTKTQISNGIGVPLEISSLRSRYSPILFGIKEKPGLTLRIASNIFVEQRFPLKEDFVNVSAHGFDCGTQALDFATQPDLAVRTINNWVEQKTEGLIKNLLDSSAISQDTRVVLTNAVYFKGKWATPFTSSFTRPRKFHLAGGNEVDINMMQGDIWSRYGRPKELNAKVLELPYSDGEMSMVILLPDVTSSIAELERKISAETFDLNEIITNHTYADDIFVVLPKFRLEMKTNLKSSLLKIGISDMFTDHADFSGMSTASHGLQVSKVIQKAFIEVSEEGTKAAAATGGLISLISAPPDFRADRPFVFILWHKKSGTRVFVGRFAGPESSL